MGSSLLVATNDSSEKAKLTADFVGDGFGDQDEINQAIAALPLSGGRVDLAAGTYDIRRVPGMLGGVLVDRENVTLVGVGASTRLILAPEQNTNVVRGTASNFHACNFWIDGNSFNNPNPLPFEGNGIRVSGVPNPFTSVVSNVTVDGVIVCNANTLGFQLIGLNVRVVRSSYYLSSPHTTHDAFELGLGPGELCNNYTEIGGQIGYVLGSDTGEQINISNNLVRVVSGGTVTEAVIRPWPNKWGHIVTNNNIRADGGMVNMMLIVEGGESNVIIGNVFGGNDLRSRVRIASPSAVVTGNVFQYIDVELNTSTVWGSNLLLSSTTAAI